MRKLLLSLALVWLVSSFVAVPAYARDWFDIIPDPNLEDLNDFPSPAPDRNDVPNVNPNVEPFLPGETIPEYVARTDPDASRKHYANNKIYDPDQDHVGDWDLDGIPDNRREDRIYGVDAPDPDPDPDPELVLETTTEETTVEQTTAEETTAEETTGRFDDTSSDSEGGSGPGPILLLLAIVAGTAIYRRRNGRQSSSSALKDVSMWDAAVAVLLPPLAVFLWLGLGKHFWANVLLTTLGYLPGIVHAAWLMKKY